MASKRPITWIFVTDHKKAKMLINNGPKTGLKQVLIEDAEARLRQAANVAQKSKNTGWWIFGSKSAQKPTPVKQKPKKQANLIEDVASLINRASKNGQFDTLLMVGPKETISSIRDKLNNEAESRLHGELSKDLTNASVHELERYLGIIISL